MTKALKNIILLVKSGKIVMPTPTLICVIPVPYFKIAWERSMKSNAEAEIHPKRGTKIGNTYFIIQNKQFRFDTERPQLCQIVGYRYAYDSAKTQIHKGYKMIFGPALVFSSKISIEKCGLFQCLHKIHHLKNGSFNCYHK